jgi:hypothetical protein
MPIDRSTARNGRARPFGTLGGLVVDRETGERLLLSNWHVGDHGPSGSLWLDRARLGGVGLYFATHNSPERLQVAEQPVVDSLVVDIAVEHRGVAALLRRVSIPV